MILYLIHKNQVIRSKLVLFKYLKNTTILYLRITYFHCDVKYY